MSESGLTIEVFRDVYNQLKGDGNTANLQWILVFLGDQVISQPIGLSNALLVISNKSGRYFTLEDFAFLDTSRTITLGSTTGKYKFYSFIRDVFGAKGIGILVTMLTAVGYASYSYIPTQVELNVSNALISALSIFISIFSLFVLTVDPEREYRYLRQSRYHILTQSDKYIGAIGIGALVLAIATNSLASLDREQILINVAIAVLFAASLVITGTAFWLVLDYHFGRRHQLAEVLMAQTVLKRFQDAAIRPEHKSTNRSRQAITDQTEQEDVP